MFNNNVGGRSNLVEEQDEEEKCSACNLVRPESTPMHEEVFWIGCDICQKWYHQVCEEVDDN